MRKNWKTAIDFILYRLVMFLLDLQNNYQFKKIYGSFRFHENYRQRRIERLKSESGIILGAIEKFIQEIQEPINTLLLPGENNFVKEAYRKHFGIKETRTTGIQDGMDYFWNFEEDPPSMGKYQLIVSQAILEHLINPYKHMVDLATLLQPRGYLVVHSVLPGYFYHRYPLD